MPEACVTASIGCPQWDGMDESSHAFRSVSETHLEQKECNELLTLKDGVLKDHATGAGGMNADMTVGEWYSD